MATRLSLASVGIWWAIFSIPLFRRVPEPPRGRLETDKVENPIKGGFARLLGTLRELRLYRQLLIFIIAFWIYNDGIGTIIKMATIYGAEIGIGQIDLIGALLLTQFVGIPFSLIFGRLPRRSDPSQAFFLGMILYNALTLPLIGILAPRFGHHQRPDGRRHRAGQPDPRVPAEPLRACVPACAAGPPPQLPRTRSCWRSASIPWCRSGASSWRPRWSSGCWR